MLNMTECLLREVACGMGVAAPCPCFPGHRNRERPHARPEQEGMWTSRRIASRVSGKPRCVRAGTREERDTISPRYLSGLFLRELVLAILFPGMSGRSCRLCRIGIIPALADGTINCIQGETSQYPNTEGGRLYLEFEW